MSQHDPFQNTVKSKSRSPAVGTVRLTVNFSVKVEVLRSRTPGADVSMVGEVIYQAFPAEAEV